MNNVDNCKFIHALTILDNVDTGYIGNFEGDYMYRCDPWFLDVIRLSLKLTLERYSHE